jgi:hypothetical protein
LLDNFRILVDLVFLLACGIISKIYKYYAAIYLSKKNPKKKILAKYRIQKSQGKIIPNQLKKSCNLHLATSNQYQTVLLNFD